MEQHDSTGDSHLSSYVAWLHDRERINSNSTEPYCNPKAQPRAEADLYHYGAHREVPEPERLVVHNGNGGIADIYTMLNAYCPDMNLSSASSYPKVAISNPPPYQQSHHQQTSDMLSSYTSPPMFPTDARDQEKSKAEQNRLRQRMNKQRCVQRKKERQARLEEKVKFLENENAWLANTLSFFRGRLAQLEDRKS